MPPPQPCTHLTVTVSCGSPTAAWMALLHATWNTRGRGLGFGGATAGLRVQGGHLQGFWSRV